MKKFIKNHLAVILSFAIILTTILPVIGGVFVSANEAEIAAAVETLKTEWGKLEVYNGATQAFSKYYDAAGQTSTSLGKPVSGYTGTIPEGVRLGNTYCQFTLSGAVTPPDTKQVVVLGGDSSTKINALKDIYLWAKADHASTSDVTVSFRVLTSGGGVLFYTDKSYTIPASKSGEWVKISLNEVTGGFKANLSHRGTETINTFHVWFSGANGDVITLGSSHFTTTATLPENSNDWSAKEWVVAAKAVTNIAGDDTAFRAAIVALMSVLDEDIQKDIVITEFKNAWANLGTVINSPLRTESYYFAGSKIADIGQGASTYTGELPDDVKLGSHYAEVTLTDAEINVAGRSQQLFLSGNSANLTGDIENIYFWVKPTFAGEENISFKVSVTYSGQNTYTNPVVIPASKDGQWIKISLDELGGGDWKANLATAASRNVMRLELTFTGNNGDKVLVGSAFEVTAKPRELPAGSSSWTVDEWIMAASELDLNGALNVDAFNAAMEELVKFASGSPAELKAIAELKSAWANLGEAELNKLMPKTYCVGSNKTDVSKPIASLGEQVDETINLGKKYATFTLNGAGEMGTNIQVLLFDEGMTTAKTIGEIDNLVLWVKPTFAGTADMTISFRICYPYGSGAMTYTTNYTIPASDSGKWIKLDLNEITGGYKSALSAIYDKPISRLDVCFSGNEGDVVTAGSVLAYTKKAFPAGSQNWGVDEWINAAEALDLSAAVNIAEFKAAVDKLYAYASISREEKTAIKQLKAAWAKMGTMESTYRIPNRWLPNGEKDPDYRYSQVGVGTAPEGVTLGSIYSSVTLDGTGDLDGNKQIILYEYVNGETAKKPTNMVEDIAVWVKLDFPAGATEDATVQWRLQHSKGLRGLHDVTIPASKSGEWVKLSVTEAEGAGWSAAYTDESIPSRLDASFIAPEGTVVTTGSVYTISSVSDTVPSADESADWNVADWLYACSHINPETHTNSEDFVAARAYAEEVRDRLLIARSCEKQDFATLEDAENGIDSNLITDTNMLEGIAPDASVYDGTTAAPVTENGTLGNITDADALTALTIDGLAGNSDTFVDFVFDVEGLATVNQMLIVNDGTLLADKYYIYVGDSRSELFLGKNLVAAHTLVENNAVQFINFTNNAIPEGKFIGVRFYTDNTTLTIPEIVAYGPVTIYSVEKGTYDDVMVAALGKNLLKGIEPRFKTSSSQKQNWTMFKNQFSVQSKIESLTDGDMSTGVGYYQQNPETVDDKCTLHFFYDLGDTYTIQQIHLQHINLAGYQTGEYEIYASPDLASLFSAKNKIISYDNRVNGPNGTSVTQVFTLNKQINARYVSFCIKFPVSDFERLSAGVNQGLGIRLMELGVYGTRYEKPYALVNLGAGAALDVTKVDASGKSEKINDKDYDGTEHKFTYDGLANTYASVDLADDEKLEFFYDLAADQVINKLQIKTNAGTIKQMKIYASDKLEEMYKSSSMVLNYNALVEDMGNEVFVDFTESPRKMRYVRFVIEDIEGNIFEPSEIEIIGGNDQEFFYNNLAEGKSDTAAFFISSENGTMATSEHANKWKFGHTTWSVMYHSGNALDNDPDTVFDFYGGKNGEETLNMLIDMGTLNSIDNIKILGGSSEQYWPEEINFYFGTNDLDLYSEKAVPAKKWTSKPADGVFSFDFVPQIAQYVRVEIVRSDDTIYSLEKYGNKIATVLAEIQVNGLEARGRVVNGVVASFTDKETGIAVDINALRDNDVYTTVQDILVKKRAATADEKASVKNENNMQLLSDVYEIYLLDLNGNIVTDFDGRTVTFRIPQSLAEQTDDVYLLNGGWGGFNMVEFETVNGYYCAVFDDATFSTFALGAYAEFDEEIEEEEEPEEVIPDEEEEEEEIIEEEPEEDEDDDDDKPKRKKKIKVIRKNNDENGYLWIIIVAVGAFAVAAGVVLFIILKKKKNKEEEEE